MERTPEQLWNIKCCDKCSKAGIHYYSEYYGCLKCPYHNDTFTRIFLQRHYCNQFKGE